MTSSRSSSRCSSRTADLPPRSGSAASILRHSRIPVLSCTQQPSTTPTTSVESYFPDMSSSRRRSSSSTRPPSVLDTTSSSGILPSRRPSIKKKAASAFDAAGSAGTTSSFCSPLCPHCNGEEKDETTAPDPDSDPRVYIQRLPSSSYFEVVSDARSVSAVSLHTPTPTPATDPSPPRHSSSNNPRAHMARSASISTTASIRSASKIRVTRTGSPAPPPPPPPPTRVSTEIGRKSYDGGNAKSGLGHRAGSCRCEWVEKQEVSGGSARKSLEEKRKESLDLRRRGSSSEVKRVKSSSSSSIGKRDHKRQGSSSDTRSRSRELLRPLENPEVPVLEANKRARERRGRRGGSEEVEPESPVGGVKLDEESAPVGVKAEEPEEEEVDVSADVKQEEEEVASSPSTLKAESAQASPQASPEEASQAETQEQEEEAAAPTEAAPRSPMLDQPPPFALDSPAPSQPEEEDDYDDDELEIAILDREIAEVEELKSPTTLVREEYVYVVMDDVPNQGEKGTQMGRWKRFWII